MEKDGRDRALRGACVICGSEVPRAEDVVYAGQTSPLCEACASAKQEPVYNVPEKEV